MKTKLTEEEKEILDSFEKGEWIEVLDQECQRGWVAGYLVKDARSR